MRLKDLFSFLNRVDSYAQHGEDLLIKSYFELKHDGFYIDVGAHHPFRFSNTYRFYKSNWRGINIDPLPGTKKLFDQVRPRDINLEFGVAKSEGVLEYYMFDEPALNGFSKHLSESRDHQTNNNYHIIGKKEIQVLPLVKILDKYMPVNTQIDFLSVDVEGLDLDVLSSNDWIKYRPNMVIAEDLEIKLDCLESSEIYNFLHSVNYMLVGKTLNSLIFKDQNV